jgi:hypothetical protein
MVMCTGSGGSTPLASGSMRSTPGYIPSPLRGLADYCRFADG